MRDTQQSGRQIGGEEIMGYEDRLTLIDIKDYCRASMYILAGICGGVISIAWSVAR